MTINPSILIVDDQPVNLGVLYEALESTGYNVRVADSGEAALESVRRAPPDMIVLDVLMPGLDGFETCRRLKAYPAIHDVPVIFMTALTESVDEIAGLRLGAVDYITKPIQVETVLARITTHMTLRQLQQTLQRQNAELDAYARMVAHDLKSPLTTVVSSADFLLNRVGMIDKVELAAYLSVIHNAGQRAITTVEELLVLAGVRQAQVVSEPLDMATIVDQAQRRIAFLIEDYHGTLTLPKTWPVAYGHAPWIELVWANYLSNGLKYGGQPPYLWLGADHQPDGMVRFWIRDNGSGLNQESQALLFTEWTRLQPRRADGHGLGLSIVRQIVEKLGGTVGVESDVGQGSQFYFTLPANEPHPQSG